MERRRDARRCSPENSEANYHHDHYHRQEQQQRAAVYRENLTPPEAFSHFYQQQMRILLHERRKLSCERATIEFLLAELKKTREELLARAARYQEGGNPRFCECEDFKNRSDYESREWGRGPSHYDGEPESSASTSISENSSRTSWSSSGSQHDFEIDTDTSSRANITLDPINATDSTSSSPSPSGSSSSELEQKPSASLFSGPTLVAIVVLTALPAAIVIGVFFLRKRRR